MCFRRNRGGGDGGDILPDVLSTGIDTALAMELSNYGDAQGYTEEEATDRAVKIFESLDKNGDGSLAEDEFIKVGSDTDRFSSVRNTINLWAQS